MHPPGWIGCPAVHPRVCGERQSGSSGSQTGGGSSPRVRGTLRRLRSLNANFRFIPACAGNASCSRTRRRDFPVHPRVCGERDDSDRADNQNHGSSPRVRGTRCQCSGKVGLLRFIPACAGNAVPMLRKGWPVTVHPRVCGERALSIAPVSDVNGSSPRVRGTHGRPVVGYPVGRFIPACAGNARRIGFGTATHSVHPRVCGERLHLPGGPPPGLGSSPRVRGTRKSAVAGRIPRRFIPACAGNATRRRT